MTFFVVAIFLVAVGLGFLFDGILIVVSHNYFTGRQDFLGSRESETDSEKKYYFANRYSIGLSQSMYGLFAIIGGIIVITAI